MRAIAYTRTGGPEVLELVDRPLPVPGPGEVRVRVAVSAVNPTDWKARRGAAPGQALPFPQVVPNQDGSGTIDAVGDGIDAARVGERVWLWEAAWRRADGTAQEAVVLPSAQAVPLPEGASYDLGAALGIPVLTAHRALSVAEEGPTRVGSGSHAGRTVLVQGGAGAVGNAAVQLATWAGATVIATVSGPQKAALARAAGAHHVIDYRTADVAEAVHRIAPDGVDHVVEVAPSANAAVDAAVVARYGSVAVYADDDAGLTLAVRPLMAPNARWQFVLVYTMPPGAKRAAVEDVAAAVAAGAVRIGEGAGLPVHRFPLERTADAHAAVEGGAVGRVLIDV